MSPTELRRALLALVSSGALAVGGVGAAGCGGDEDGDEGGPEQRLEQEGGGDGGGEGGGGDGGGGIY